MVRVYRTIEKRLNDAVADAITHRKLKKAFRHQATSHPEALQTYTFNTDSRC